MKKLYIIIVFSFLGCVVNAQGTWALKAIFSGGARIEIASFSIGNKGYFGTGFDGASYKQDFWEWDQATDVWTQKANFGGTARDRATGFSIGTKGYIGTGFDGGYKQDFWEYAGPGSGVNEINLDDLISVYPNPSNGKFTLSSEITKGEISIYNISGEKVYSSTVNRKQETVNLSSQPNGIYFLTIKTEQGTANKKLIINK